MHALISLFIFIKKDEKNDKCLCFTTFVKKKQNNVTNFTGPWRLLGGCTQCTEKREKVSTYLHTLMQVLQTF